MYHYQALDHINLQELADCFNAAFSDYEQSIHFTTESLNYYLTASTVDLSLSYGALYNGQLVGFILNSSGTYNEQRVVFDAGTGIVPDHRGKKVFSGLFEYTVQQLKDRNITKYFLEILQSNHSAVSIYSKKGFSVQRAYSVLVATGSNCKRNDSVCAIPYQDFAAFTTKFSVAPSYEHTSFTINQNPHLYEVLYLDRQAYCIYAKKNGAIVQLHYDELNALRNIISSLVDRFPSAMAKNIDCNCRDVVQMLQDIGFNEILKQYEMALDI